MSVVQERYNYIVVDTNASVPIYGNNVGGFLAATAGTVTLVANPSDGKPETTILDDFAVAAGVYYPIPILIGKNGGTFTAGGGASGVLCV